MWNRKKGEINVNNDARKSCIHVMKNTLIISPDIQPVSQKVE